MENILTALENFGFYTYEDPILVPVIQKLQLRNNSVWIIEGRYEELDVPDNELMEYGDDGFLYLDTSLPPYRCFLLDIEDIYEYPQSVFEDYEYLRNSLRKCRVFIEDVDEYEDSEGHLHLITNAGDFLICPTEFRSSFTPNCLNWQVTAFHTILMLNNLLSQVKSTERFYVLYQEDECLLAIVLLNSSMFNFFQNSEQLKNQYLPKPVKTYFESILSLF